MNPCTTASASWEPPWGIEFRLDLLNALLALLIASIAFVVVIFAGPSVEARVAGQAA